MKKTMTMLGLLICLSAQALADTGALGIRLGAVTRNEGMQYELYGRYFPAKLLLTELSWGYGKRDSERNGIPMEGVEQSTVTGLAGIRLPLGIVSAYAAGGVSGVFVDRKKGLGSPVVQAGFELPLGRAWYLNGDYRHQLRDPANYWFGGWGVRF